ncbi:MAG TPA: Ig domain-containing protein [bacterium]|nr:Ig domain-containing protein [bacterium]
MKPRLATAVLALTGLTACLEDVDFFFSVNGQVFQDVAQSGNGVIIGIGRDDAQSSTLVDGGLPAGMTLQTDGTIAGLPEETGTFKFTVETIDADGRAHLLTSLVEIDEATDAAP